MIPAIFSRTYPLTTARDTFAAARADGFAAVQFNLSNLAQQVRMLDANRAAPRSHANMSPR